MSLCSKRHVIAVHWDYQTGYHPKLWQPEVYLRTQLSMQAW